MKNQLLSFVFICLYIHLFAQSSEETLSVVIIGSGSPKYNPKRSGPSVLISYKDTKILVDMGNGTQANLDKLGVGTKQLDGLFFTHHHLDHNEEFIPIFIHCLIGGNTFTIAGPDPTSAFVTNILNLYKEDIEYRMGKSGRTLNDVKSNFTIKDLKGEETFTLGGIKVTCTKVNHTIYTVAYRFEADGKSIVISGDLSYSESLPVLAKNADYLVIDSGGTIQEGAQSNRRPNKSGPQKERAHVNLDESSRMAKEANVKNLVLTHFNITNIDSAATVKEIRKNFEGNILFAADLMVIPQSNTNQLSGIESVSNQQNENGNRPSFEKTVSQMDTNKDGKIDKSEAKGRLKENFSSRDKNQDGYITKDEFQRRN
jgi:ribonuclease BN (tRNA processing enzyme)